MRNSYKLPIPDSEVETKHIISELHLTESNEPAQSEGGDRGSILTVETVESVKPECVTLTKKRSVKRVIRKQLITIKFIITPGLVCLSVLCAEIHTLM